MRLFSGWSDYQPETNLNHYIPFGECMPKSYTHGEGFISLYDPLLIV